MKEDEMITEDNTFEKERKEHLAVFIIVFLFIIAKS